MKKGLTNLVALIIIAVLLILIIGIFVASAAIVGSLTSNVGKDKPMIGASSSGSDVGKTCVNSLEGHTLAEVGIANGQAKVSQFGSPDPSLPTYCRDTGDNGRDGFDGSTRPTGCDVNNPSDYFAAVCPGGGGATCGGNKWWHKQTLIVSYNGKSVNVTVRDRGPNPSTGRQLDLSYAAMKTLGAGTDAVVSVCLAGGSTLSGQNVGMGCGNVPSYKQYDPAWANVSYDCSDGSTIKSSGCGITAAAMVLNFYGNKVDPPQMAQAAISSGNRACGSGTGHGFFPYIAQKYGLKDENGISWDRAMTLLKQGKPIIVSGNGPRPFSSGGHFIVLTCYNSDGTIAVNDSAHPDASYPEALLKQYQHFATAMYK